jgi:hypothetical protein
VLLLSLYESRARARARSQQIDQMVAANFSFPEQHTLARNANWITSLAVYGRGDESCTREHCLILQWEKILLQAVGKLEW